MKSWSTRQILALFLSVFLSIGMSLSVVQAADMTAKMAMASGASGHDGCSDCTDGGGDMKVMACKSICVAPIVALFPQARPVTLVSKPGPFAARYPLLYGRLSPPDPYPPRPTDIV